MQTSPILSDLRCATRVCYSAGKLGPWYCVVCLLLSLCPVRALAQPEGPLRMVWIAPAGCPTELEVEAVIRRWLSESPDVVDAHTLSVRAQVFPESAQETQAWTLDLELESQTGRAHERLQASACATLAEVVGLKVSSAATLLAELKAMGARTTPVPRVNPELTKPPAPAEGARAINLRLVAGAAVGRLPSASGVVSVIGAITWSQLRVELGVSYGLPATAWSRHDPDLGVRLQLVSGTARACAMLHARMLTFPICAGVELGVLRGIGVGLGVQPLRSDQWFGELLLGPALRWTLTERMGLWLEVSAAVAWLRPGYHVRGMSELYRLYPANARVLGGLELRLW